MVTFRHRKRTIRHIGVQNIPDICTCRNPALPLHRTKTKRVIVVRKSDNVSF